MTGQYAKDGRQIFFILQNPIYKYHYPWCPSMKGVPEENRVYYQTIEEARAAGLSPAANCKGLK